MLTANYGSHRAATVGFGLAFLCHSYTCKQTDDDDDVKRSHFQPPLPINSLLTGFFCQSNSQFSLWPARLAVITGVTPLSSRRCDTRMVHVIAGGTPVPRPANYSQRPSSVPASDCVALAVRDGENFVRGLGTKGDQRPSLAAKTVAFASQTMKDERASTVSVRCGKIGFAIQKNTY